MAKKPIKKPGRPAKPAPKQKVQKFAKGEEVFAQAPGVLNEQPQGIPEQKRAQQVRAVAEGAMDLGNKVSQAATAAQRAVRGFDARAADKGFMASLGDEVGALRTGAEQVKVADKGFMDSLGNEVGAVRTGYGRAKDLDSSLYKEMSREVGALRDRVAPTSQYSPEQLAAIRRYSESRGLSPDMGMTRRTDDPALVREIDSSPARALWRMATGQGLDSQSQIGPGNPFEGSGRQRPAAPPEAPPQIGPGNPFEGSGRQRPAAPAQSPGLLSAEDAQAMANDALNTARTPSAPDANGWVTHKGPAPARLPSPGPTNNQGAFRADGSAIAVPSSKSVNTVSSGAMGAVAGGSYQGDRDVALLQKWYSMSPNERGAMPASVMEAKHRGANDHETMMNIARARIMESGLPPERLSESLAKLEQIRAGIEQQGAERTRWGRQDDMQAARDAEAGRHNQAGEQNTREEQASLDEYRRGQNATSQWAAATTAADNQTKYANEQERIRLERRKADQGDKRFRAMPEISPDITEMSDPALYKQMVDNQRKWIVAQQDWYNLASENQGASDDELMQLAFAPTDGKLRPAAYYYDPEFLGRRRSSGYAGGGMVQSPVYGGPPALPRIDPIMADYRQYVLRAQQQGVPTVSFERFAQLKAGAFQGQPQQPVAMAKGGAVPAAGKMVIDTNPNAKTDSIPAVIDGKAPARLDSGEFVIPADVVRHYGTKFLHNLIEKANGAM